MKILKILPLLLVGAVLTAAVATVSAEPAQASPDSSVYVNVEGERYYYPYRTYYRRPGFGFSFRLGF